MTGVPLFSLRHSRYLRHTDRKCQMMVSAIEAIRKQQEDSHACCLATDKYIPYQHH